MVSNLVAMFGGGVGGGGGVADCDEPAPPCVPDSLPPCRDREEVFPSPRVCAGGRQCCGDGGNSVHGDSLILLLSVLNVLALFGDRCSEAPLLRSFGDRCAGTIALLGSATGAVWHHCLVRSPGSA